MNNIILLAIKEQILFTRMAIYCGRFDPDPEIRSSYTELIKQKLEDLKRNFETSSEKNSILSLLCLLGSPEFIELNSKFLIEKLDKFIDKLHHNQVLTILCSINAKEISKHNEIYFSILNIVTRNLWNNFSYHTSLSVRIFFRMCQLSYFSKKHYVDICSVKFFKLFKNIDENGFFFFFFLNGNYFDDFKIELLDEQNYFFFKYFLVIIQI